MEEESAVSDLQGRDEATVVRGADSHMEEPVHVGNSHTAAKPGPAPMFSTPLDEKPLFHSSQGAPATSAPYILSGNGDRVPYTINRYLRDYQREGIRFIYSNYTRSRGCILGDDMGLGKTIQVIAFLAAVLHKTGTWEDIENNVPHFLLSQSSSKQRKTTKVFLIVAPLSVLYNWKDELDTWGHFRVIIVHGTRREEEFARIRRGRCEIALTTYETLRLCVEQFNSIDWSAVIVDEAHRIKNPNSQITQAMKRMKCRVRVGLTGTVLQNNLEELWCVMDWASPRCLGTLEEFRVRFSNPVEQGQRHSATKRALAMGREAAQLLTQRLSRYFLRRTKALIGDQLPRKDDRVVFCSLTEFQQTVYQAVLDSEDVRLILRSGQRCCGTGRPRSKCCFKNNSKGIPVKGLYFSYLAILRKVANHVALLQPRGGTSKKQEQYVNEICGKVFQKFPDFMQRCKQAAFEAMSDPMYSGKMKVLQRLLNHYMQNKDKVLLFSLSTKLLDILESYCMATGLEYRRLDGTTRSKDRLKIVKEFNSSMDINICLVSTMAGGLGLNFVGANIVVLFDPTWNPASDLQAIDRVYRIGQYRDVTVLRLISLGSVEEIIYLRQVYKQQLQSAVVASEHARRYFEAVQGPDGHYGELFGIRNLFRLQTHGTCLTRQILEREGQMEAGIMMAQTEAGERADERTPEVQPGTDPPPAKSSTGCLGGGTSILDFSSASEDEDGCGASRKVPAPRGEAEQGSSGGVSLARLSFLHPGFSKDLQGSRTRNGQGSGPDSEESSLEEDGGLPPADPKPRGPPTLGPCEGGNILSKPEGERTGSRQPERDGTVQCIAREEGGGDEAHPQTSACARRKLRTKRRRVRQGLASGDARDSGSSSSDSAKCDELITGPLSTRRHAPERDRDECDNAQVMGETADRAGLHGDVRHTTYTRLKGTDVKALSERPDRDSSAGTIDRLLGGVQEVMYTHSNQRVVGTSRAEDRISRAAIRDVFQYGRNTQALANQLLDSAETLSGSEELHASSPAPVERGGTTEAEAGPAAQEGARQLVPPLTHPVTQTLIATRRIRNDSLIFGKTPHAMCRRQLEEMSAHFKASSTQAFAEEVLRSTSEERQAMLQEFHSLRAPHFQALVKKIFEDPEVPQCAIAAPPADSQSPSGRTSSTSQSSSHLGVQMSSTTHPGAILHDPKEGPSEHQNASEGKVASAAAPHPEGTPRTCPLSAVDRSVTPADGRAQGTGHSQDHEPSSREPCLSDLIGDTSILDDLFKRTTRTVEDVNGATSRASRPVERARGRCRDVWDILSEDNEECINKLTDLSQVEKMCNSASVSVRERNDGLADSPQLWRKNERFLWKI